MTPANHRARDDATSILDHLSFDRSSRYVLVGRTLAALGVESGKVLDVGGSEGLSRLVLPGCDVITADIRALDADVIASADYLPFCDKSFSAAVALDVLEHIPQALRDRAIDRSRWQCRSR